MKTGKLYCKKAMIDHWLSMDMIYHGARFIRTSLKLKQSFYIKLLNNESEKLTYQSSI